MVCDTVDLKSINSVRFFGFVCDRFEDYFCRNFCIFPLVFDGESAVLPMKLIANLVESLRLNRYEACLA